MSLTTAAGGRSDTPGAFGLREFRTEGTQFLVNGRRTFLRGKHDACVFPLTGYPPMEAPGWKHVFKIAKRVAGRQLVLIKPRYGRRP